ncbi:hypothetical protein EVAR_5677_1 [Eumeta japonica]|uniref:Uncharacterized protein n=1 Tax=Eumeta variegata TaxID=151549 RepID=A0A4C1T868_EUMVA|nr:hypothetical protein EVAR_5677_1 [Eumeta japonica]
MPSRTLVRMSLSRDVGGAAAGSKKSCRFSCTYPRRVSAQCETPPRRRRSRDPDHRSRSLHLSAGSVPVGAVHVRRRDGH